MTTNTTQLATTATNWIEDEKRAFELISVVGHLWFNKSVELVIFRKKILDRSASQILRLHDYGQTVIKREFSIADTLELAKGILASDIFRARIDIGRLANEWAQEKINYANSSDFIHSKLNEFVGREKNPIEPKDVILFGFGRIGRIVARELIEQSGKGEQLRLKAIVTRGNSDEQISKRAALLRTDSVHGEFIGLVKEDLENKELIINGQRVKMIAANSPEEVDYTTYGISNALLIDNTGVYRDREGLERHLQSKGVEKVLLTAPGKGDIPNIVYGVNHSELDLDKESIYSAASCTTNAIVPVLSVIEKELGIEKGHLETIHAYTNDQNLQDNFHKKYRRGRAAALNMVLTETGASKAAARVIPSLNGKLTASAVRVPTPNASIAILMLTLSKDVTVEEINGLLEKAAHSGDLVSQIEYSYNNELVSADIVGRSAPAVVDSPSTKVSSDQRNAVIYVWYDNEYGYSRQVVRLAKHISKVRLLRYY
ncbi:MAG: glyceraldehyde-3-phosphate dehydrogenase [Marinifilaceae bacterium]